MIFGDYCNTDVNIDMLLKMYQYATKQNLEFFKIDCNSNDVNEKFSKNFNEFMKIEDV